MPGWYIFSCPLWYSDVKAGLCYPSWNFPRLYGESALSISPVPRIQSVEGFRGWRFGLVRIRGLYLKTEEWGESYAVLVDILQQSLLTPTAKLSTVTEWLFFKMSRNISIRCPLKSCLCPSVWFLRQLWYPLGCGLVWEYTNLQRLWPSCLSFLLEWIAVTPF